MNFLRIIISTILIAQFTNLLFGQLTMQNLPKDTTLYTVGYSHLDTQWRWDYQTTIREYVKNTMVDNFALFEKYPNYILNFSGANRYRMMKEYYPEDFERVRRYVSENRWFPCGSSMEESDVLAPSPESIIRQILYGNIFFRKEFGKASDEFMLPDCFGFPASLPTILSHCGMRGFSTQKLTWGSAIGIPFNIGRWIGPDGSSVLAVFNPGDYVGKIREDLSNSSKWLERITNLGKLTGAFSEYMYYGTGDMGGAPSEESVQWLEKSIAGTGPIRVLSSPANVLFDNISEEQAAKYPTYKGELLLTNHSAGSLTSAAYMKRWNRKNEILATAAEASAVIGEWLGGLPYPKEKLQEAWRLVLGGQFHDILPGTCIPRAYEFSWNDEVLALNQFGGALSDAVGASASAMDTRTVGVPLLLFNPLADEREEVVKATVAYEQSCPKFVRVFGPDGKEILSQILDNDGTSITLLILVKVPSVGFTVFDVRPSQEPSSLATDLFVTESSLENARYKILLNANGDPRSIYDKVNQREILTEPARLAFQYERPLEWPAWNMDWNDRKQPPRGYVEGPVKIRIAEKGPVRIALEIDRESRGSRIIQCIQLSANGQRVDFDTKIDWFTHESSLKATFPLTVANPVATYNGGIGTVERGNNDPKRFEVPSHQWIDLTERNGSYGVSILEDCKYGSDKPSDNVLRLTLLYTPGVRSGYKDQATQDFGKHEMLYSVYAHASDWRAGNSDWEAARINHPIRVFQTVPHEGFLGKSYSFLRLNNRAVGLMALKKSELSEDLILRFREIHGARHSMVQAILPAVPTDVREVNGQEQTLAELKSGEKNITFDIGPYEIKSFALRLPPPEQRVIPPSSQPLQLSYDVCAFTSDKDKSAGNFDQSGASYPAELIPVTINSGGILFSLGHTGNKSVNAVACKGQIVKVPKGNYNRLFILAAASEKDTEATFVVDGKSTALTIAEWSGFIGQWDNRIWDRYAPRTQDFVWDSIYYRGLTPGFIKPHNVAAFTTHRHLASGENEPYIYGYIFRYYLDLPEGASEIRLPVNDKIRIFAMTAARDNIANTFPAHPLYDKLDRKKEDYGRFQLTATPKIFSPSYIIEEDSSVEVSITTDDVDAEIHYTLDGSEPTETSPKYTMPFTLSSNTMVKAIAAHPEKQPSYVDSARYYRAYAVQSIRNVTQPSPKYSGRGEQTLINSIRAPSSFGDKEWQGYEATDVDVVLDLGRVRTVRRVTVGCLSDNASWIFLPVKIEVRTSRDGIEYSPIKARAYEIPSANEGVFIKDLVVDINPVEVQYVSVNVKNIGTCPSWHSGAGGKAWLFVDEIFIE